jgi:integrase
MKSFLITDNSNYTWEDAVKEFKKYAYTHYVNPSACMYVIRLFSEIVHDMPLKDIKLMHVEQYIQQRKELVKASSINREVNTIRKVFSLAVDNDIIEYSPCRKVKTLRVYHNPVRYLAKQEEVKLLNACSPFMQSVVKVALYTGMRKNEILSLQWDDIDFKGRYLIARETKNNKVREIPMCSQLISVLQGIKRQSVYVFTNPETGTRYQDIYCTFRRAVYRARIRPITFHQLRHTTASRLNELGVDIVTIQEILGHASIKTTMRYTHNRRESKIRAMDLLGTY